MLKLDPNGSNFPVLQLKISFLCGVYRMWCVTQGKWINWGILRQKRTSCIFFFFLTGGELLHSVLLVFAVQQHESAVSIHTPPLNLLPPTASFLGHCRAPRWVPCTDAHSLSVWHMVMCISCCCLVTKLCLTLWPHGLYPARLPCPWISQARILE